MASITDLRANLVATVQEEDGVDNLALNSQVVTEASELLRHLGQDVVVFNRVVIGSIQNDLFKVTGTVRAFSGDNDATLSVRVSDDGTPQLSLALSPLAADWGFRDAFPNLPQSPGTDGVLVVLKESCFYDLSVGQPVFTVSTFESDQLGISEGIVFDAQISLGDTFHALKQMIDSQSQIACHGSIEISNSSPLIQLEAALGELTFPLAGDEIKNIVLQIETTADSEGTPAQSHALLSGQVTVSSSTPPVTVEASILEGDFVWQFRALFAENEIALANEFAELAQLAGIQSTDFELPDEVQAFTSFYLTEIGVGVIPADMTIQYVSFAVASPEVWHTPIPDIQVTALGVGWTFLLGPPVTSHGYVFGDLVLGRDAGEFTLEVSAQLPDFVIFADLPEGEEIDLRKVVETYFSKYLFEHNFVVDRLELMTEPSASIYEMEIEIKDDWPIVGNLILSPMSFTIKSQTGSVSGSLTAQLTLDELRFFVRAAYSEDGYGLQFIGGSLADEPIPIGDLVQKLATQFNVASDFPQALEDLVIENLTTSFNTATKDFTFTCEAQFTIEEGETVDITVTIDLTHQQDGSFEKYFGGDISVDVPISTETQTLLFDLKFIEEIDAGDASESSQFIATYSHSQEQSIPTVKAIVNAFSSRVAGYIPQGVTVDLQDVIFAFDQPEETKLYLFGVDIDISIDLSDLPLIGGFLSADGQVGVNPLQIIATSGEISQEQVAAFNELIPEGVNALPDQTLQEGFNISGMLQLASSSEPLTLPAADSSTTAPAAAPASPTSTSATTDDNALWYKIQRSFGPLDLERIGLQYHQPDNGEKAAIAFLLDASLSAFGLTLTLEGFSIAVDLEDIPSLPQFNLSGLGVDYEGGPFEIGGAFLKGTITYDGKEYDDYSGTAILRTETLTLAAIGSYVLLDVGPSMFVYAVLDYPIGGPAFFFVRGLAAGFGYNRLLNAPSIDRVDTFPLVQEAVEGVAGTPNLADELAKLEQYIPPSVGNYFLAIGIRFTSFEMLDSFVLVTATFGHRFELDVVGLSTLVLPAPDAENADVTPIAEVQLALRATFIPEDGFIGVSAQLTNNSYLLSRKCHLTGGFALYTWFSGDYDYAGDFVLSVGGYHPKFSRPDHYPTVSPLGFNWQVDDHVTFKGSAYYALIPSALMAGCSLSATWEDGSLKAWFDAGADFLISWRPYHYEADAHVSIGASYTFHLFGAHHVSTHVGADVSIWGPEFTGKADVSWSVISFTISFGDSSRNQLNPISWKEFSQSFLPKDTAKMCTINLQDGLINQTAAKDSKDTQQTDSIDLGVVNPKTLCLTTDAVIPIQDAYLRAENTQTTELPYDLDSHTKATTVFNIGIMELSNSDISSTLTITITSSDGKLYDIESVKTHFDFIPLAKSLPAALWGSRLKPSPQGKQLIKSLLTGYKIRVKRPDDAPNPASIDYATLQQAATLDSEPDAFAWTTLTAFVAQAKEDDSARRQIIKNTFVESDVVSKRMAIANDLLGESLNLDTFNAYDFFSAPQVNEIVSQMSEVTTPVS